MNIENKEILGYVYKVENMVNGSIYIGITTNDLASRKIDHLQKTKTGSGIKFHEAIATFGEDNFNWEVIDTSFDTNDLAKKEKNYIIEYDSKENGYNGSAGGEIAKKVYQYDLKDGSLIATYETLTEAGNVVNATKKQMSSVCLSVHQTYKGYYWSYEYKEPFVQKKDCRKKEIIQLDDNGIMIATYVSVAEASRQTGISKTCLSRVCRGERDKTHGFVFRYK